MRKRSKYRPRGVVLDTMQWIKQGMTRIDAHPAAVDLRIKNHAAMRALSTGEARRDDVDVLIAALNVTEALVTVDPDMGADWQAEIQSGQDALLHVARRGVERGDKFLCTGPELVALNLAMEIHDAQLDRCTVAELETATNAVSMAIKHKRVRYIGNDKCVQLAR